MNPEKENIFTQDLKSSLYILIKITHYETDI